MKKLTKLLALIVSLMLLTAPALAANSLEAFTPLVDEPAELTFWTYRIQSVADFETQTMTKIMEQMTGVHINWEQVDHAEKDTLLNLSLASGNYPDVYMTTFSTAQVMEYAGDVFIPLEDYITPEITPNLCKLFEKNPDVRELLTAPDGHIYTLFRTDVGVHMLSTSKMYVNTDWLNAYVDDGGAIPETTDEFEDMLIYFRDNDMNKNGDPADEMPLVSSSSAWSGNPLNYLVCPFQLLSESRPYLLADENKQVYAPIVTDEFREGLICMNHLYDEGLLLEETYVQDETQMMALVNIADKSQQIVGCFSAAWEGVFVDPNIIAYTDFTPLAPLMGPSGQRNAPVTTESGMASFVLQCAVTTACEDVELAMRYMDLAFVEYAPGEDFYIFIGQEGVSYTWDYENESMNGMSPTKVYLTLPAVQTEHWANHTMPYWDTEESRYNVYASEGSSDKALYGGHVVYAPYYKYIGIPMISWATDAELAAEMDQLRIAINGYNDSAITQFVTGVNDIEDDAAWESYVNELNNIGLQEYIAGRQIICFGE